MNFVTSIATSTQNMDYCTAVQNPTVAGIIQTPSDIPIPPSPHTSMLLAFPKDGHEWNEIQEARGPGELVNYPPGVCLICPSTAGQCWLRKGLEKVLSEYFRTTTCVIVMQLSMEDQSKLQKYIRDFTSVQKRYVNTM